MKADKKVYEFGKRRYKLTHPKANTIQHPDNWQTITQRGASQA